MQRTHTRDRLYLPKEKYHETEYKLVQYVESLIENCVNTESCGLCSRLGEGGGEGGGTRVMHTRSL